MTICPCYGRLLAINQRGHQSVTIAGLPFRWKLIHSSMSIVSKEVRTSLLSRRCLYIKYAALGSSPSQYKSQNHPRKGLVISNMRSIYIYVIYKVNFREA